jgi:hypothetical protein
MRFADLLILGIERPRQAEVLVIESAVLMTARLARDRTDASVTSAPLPFDKTPNDAGLPQRFSFWLPGSKLLAL